MCPVVGSASWQQLSICRSWHMLTGLLAQVPIVATTGSCAQAARALETVVYPCSAMEYCPTVIFEGVCLESGCQTLTNCDVGINYETVAPTWTSNRVCGGTATPCRNGSSYASTPATVTSNSVCSTCSTCSSGVAKPCTLS
jgi:hypothetical protein